MILTNDDNRSHLPDKGNDFIFMIEKQCHMEKRNLFVKSTTADRIYSKLLVNTIVSGVSVLSLLLVGIHATKAESSTSGNQADLVSESQVEESTPEMSQVTNVNQLSDVQPTDWAFQSLQSLVERYGCIAGYTNSTFRGNRALTRYEFAAGVNACLNRINELIATATADLVKREDLVTLQKLREEFAAELASLRGRVDTLEAHTAELQANQFSTTTKLQGQVIFSVNAGGFDGRSIVVPGINPANPTGNPPGNPRSYTITNQPNATVLFRAGLDLNTSFKGTDLLKLRIETGSGVDLGNGQPNGGLDNTPGLLEPNFGSVIDYSVKPPTNRDISISRIYYSFQIGQDLRATVGPGMFSTDFVDKNSYAYLSFLDFSTSAFVNNYILFPVNGPSAGAAIDWKPGQGPFSVRALYVAGEASNPSKQGTGVLQSVSSFTSILYPNQIAKANGAPNVNPNVTLGERGLFGSIYQGTAEIEYAPSRAFALRLEYSGGELFTNRFDVFGANLELTLAKKFGIFGRYGYGSYNNTVFGDIKPNYWMAGVGMRDLFTRGSLAGVAVGQPFVDSHIGNATQTNFEAFYNYPFSRNIQITPTLQVIRHAGNQESNGTIYTGTLRTVLSF